MKSILISLLCSFLLLSSSKAQQWQWSGHLTSASNVQVNAISYDAGNDAVVICAAFKGVLNIGTQAFVSAGNKDILIVRYNSSGDTLWTKHIGSVGKDTPKDIIIDASGNIYVTGSFSDGANFDGTILNTVAGTEDIFLAKYAADGTQIFAKRIGWGPDLDRGNNLTVDNNENIFLAGFYNDSIFFDSDTLVWNGITSNFIAEYNNLGNFVKTILDIHGKDIGTRLNAISLTNDGGKSITGIFADSIFFPNDTLVSKGDKDMILFKLNSLNNIEWIRQIGSTGPDQLFNSTTDKFGNIYSIGVFTGLAYIDSSGQELFDAQPINSFGGSDIFLAKYNSQGRLIWKKHIGDIGDDEGFGISVDQNQLHIGGLFSGTVIFNNDTLKTSGILNQDVFFGVLDDQGNTINGGSISGDDYDRSQGIVYDGKGNEYITGYFFSTTLAIGSDVLTNGGGSDGYIAEYHIPFKISITDKTDVTCNGGTNGSATVTPYFGTYPYTYQWSYDDGTADSTLTNVPAGNYGVKVTDANNFSDSVAFTITEPTPVTVSGSVTDVRCNSGNDGAITLTVSGGTSPYAYLWSTNTGSGLTPTAKDQSGLTAARYYVDITDDNSCLKQDSFDVSEPLPITFGGSIVTDITIPPGSNGEIDLVVNGGTPTYVFSWTGPNSYTSAEDSLFNLADAGTYNLSLVDANSCVKDSSFLVSSDTAFLAFISAKQDVSCRGGNDASVTVSTTGGTGPYTYAWRDALNNPVGANDSVLSNVPAGTYYVTVTDNFDSRTADASAVLSEPAQDLVITLNNRQHITCNGASNGLIDIGVSGGWGSYSYSWTGPGGFTATSEDITGLDAGFYSVTVTDGGGCITTLPNIEIQEPSVLSVSIAINQGILCNGELTGELEANPVGGTTPYAYAWDDPGNQTTKRATFLAAGNYTVTISDNKGCTTQTNQLLTEPPAIDVSAIVQDVSCPGSSDGLIALTVTGGTPQFSYLWTPNNEITKDISGLAGGDYSVTVTDNNNCTWDSTYSVTEPAPLVIDSVSLTDISGCPGSNNGELVIHVTGGTMPYEYSVDGGTTFQADSTFSNLTAGNYDILIRDAGSCTQAGNTVTLNDPPGVVIDSTTAVMITCQGGSDGSVTIHASGGTKPYTYSVDGGTTYQNDSTFTGLSAGNYDLAVRDANSCIVLGNTFSLTDPAGIIINTVPSDPSCNGSSDGSIEIHASGGTIPYTYSADGGTTYQADSLFSNLAAGNYDIAVQDNNGCLKLGNAVALTEPDAIVISSTDTTNTCAGLNQGAITVNVTGGTGTLTYILFLQQSALDSNNVGIFSNLDLGTYTVQVDDENSCGPVTSDAIEVAQADNCGIKIFDAFTPNGDNINDLWEIQGIQAYPNCTVQVFNTWGVMVFSSRGYPEPWDGTFNGNPLPAGTYYYVINLGPGEDTFSGTVNIVK